MAEDANTFKVWIAFLAACDPDGIARVSAAYIASVCRLPDDIVAVSIEKLKAPDPLSRSKEDSGKRIIHVDGGFFVINYEKYRAMSYSNKPEAIAKRKYREKHKNNEESGTKSGHCPDASASASASSSAIKEGMQGENKKPSTAIPANLNTPQFLSAWEIWIEWRKREKKKPTTETSQKLRLKELATMGPDRAVAAIRHSISNDYTGIFEKKKDFKTTTPLNDDAYDRFKRENKKNQETSIQPEVKTILDGMCKKI